jgi:hypothetical protein
MFELSDGKIILAREAYLVGRSQAEKLLPKFDSFFKKQKLKIKDLEGIVVVSGPGGFSSVRVGVILANTLSYSLNIPNVGIKVSESKTLEDQFLSGIKKLKKMKGFKLVKPEYGRAPNITKPKK